MKKKIPLIAITNDDGIDSPGIAALASALNELGEIVVVAPTKQQTASGRSIYGKRDAQFLRKEISADGISFPGYHCDCSPAQVIGHALNVLFIARKPDLVVSGINYGENLGTNVTHSGTVGAALEAASVGIPSIAVSLETSIENHRIYAETDWSAARYFSKIIAKKVLYVELPFDVDVLKIDVPANADEKTEIRFTRVSRQSYFSARVKSPSQKSELKQSEVYISIDRNKLEPDSDAYAILVDKVVSVSPLSVDLTSRVSMKNLEKVLI
ncbi:MAG: 5'/3'-nucleotidase SurE [Chlorobi bacterium]|nr:5'/3'-nucleotidase SurE [Chlorobiota bacterium]